MGLHLINSMLFHKILLYCYYSVNNKSRLIMLTDSMSNTEELMNTFDGNGLMTLKKIDGDNPNDVEVDFRPQNIHFPLGRSYDSQERSI